jgi:UDP-4-amino-4,6-dideoxy-N-acetyl-beta-L-altrosamine transaminase
MIPYARQNIISRDIFAVNKVLKSNFLTQGPMVEKFEKSVTKYTKSKFGVAVNSSTSALHLACLALDVKKGDYVWTSANTFVASANCAIHCGAKIDFVDINPRTYNIDINQLELKLKIAKKKNKLPKVVIPVHFAGLPCDMQRIYQLRKKYKFKIIEDASHAIGSSYKLLNTSLKRKIKVGCCEHSDITVFSFHPVKIITTGEGGIALTNKKNLYDKMKLLRSHGISRNVRENKKNLTPWYYEQISLGFNYRMNDIQSALGCEQIKRLDSFLKKRNNIATYYNKKLSKLPIDLPIKLPGFYSSFHLYVVTLSKKYSKYKRNNIFNKMRKKGIEVNLHYIPVHTHPYYQKRGFKRGDFKVSENYYDRAISLPMYPSLSLKDQDYVIKCFKECF